MDETRNIEEVVSILSGTDLTPNVGPVSTVATLDQIDFAASGSRPLADELIEQIRQDCEVDVVEICSKLKGTNVSNSLMLKLQSSRTCLSQPLSENSAIRLGCHVHALSVLMPAMSERLDDLTLAEIVGFADNVRRLLSRVGGWKAFLAEAQHVEHSSSEARDAAYHALALIRQQNDAVVNPVLKTAITDLLNTNEDVEDRVTRLSLFRSVSNVYKSVADAIKGQLKEISSS